MDFCSSSLTPISKEVNFSEDMLSEGVPCKDYSESESFFEHTQGVRMGFKKSFAVLLVTLFCRSKFFFFLAGPDLHIYTLSPHKNEEL